MMEEKNKNYCVVFAGGKGRRLWPCSRAKCPKQFIDFFGIGKTLLQQTYERMCKVVPPEHIFISTNEEYAPMVKEQLPDIKADHIMAEVVSRSTAP
ncbi:MAG TPA: mannose-1-phosphate guanylyltransferase, partial [Prevotella sp.]|nr:mannose-1-phosphate guanylyltransferase [Prevotella sp.]